MLADELNVHAHTVPTFRKAVTEAAEITDAATRRVIEFLNSLEAERVAKEANRVSGK